MTRRVMIAIAGALIVASAAGTVHADSWKFDGKVRAGGVWFDKTGDESTMPETYDIYDGFMLSSIYLKGRSGPRTHVMLDLTDINQDDRRGVLDFRRTGMLHFRSRFTQSRWVFDPVGSVDAGRKNWDNTLSYTPKKYLWFSADYNLQTRDGNRMGLNPGYEGWLGTEYDTKLHRYRVEGQIRADNGIGGTLAYDGVRQRDALDSNLERDGYVVSANLHVPGYYIKNLTHVVRGAIGHSEVSESGLGFDMMNAQYTGVWRALQWMRLRYRFYGSQVEDDATTIQTNNFTHDVDGTFSYSVAALTVGYGWEALDDDRAITTTNKFRGALSLRDPKNRISARAAFDGRDRDDAENTTLLRDSESENWDVRVDANPITQLALGGRFSDRERSYPDLGLKTWGSAATAYAAWRKPTSYRFVSLTEVGGEYTYTDEEYRNLWGSQHVVSNAVTGRLGFTLFEDLDLTGSVTYLELDKDLDMDKSIVSVGAAYRFRERFLADVKYNVYNYDDYLLIDRFYTANVVWFNVGYEFSTD
jgi:hypothetical protein